MRIIFNKFLTALLAFLAGTLATGLCFTNTSNKTRILVTYEEFRDAVKWNNYPEPSEKKYQSFISNLHLGGITTKQEAAMALAQFIWESGGLLAKREFACLKSGCPDLYKTPGCDVEGKSYYGRGYLQLTWCSNYRDASIELYGSEWLVNDPDVVARDDDVAWETAFWFWKKYVHLKPGLPFGFFGVTTRAINGDECDGPREDVARVRFEIYKVVRRAFGYLTEGEERGCYELN